MRQIYYSCQGSHKYKITTMFIKGKNNLKNLCTGDNGLCGDYLVADVEVTAGEMMEASWRG